MDEIVWIDHKPFFAQVWLVFGYIDEKREFEIYSLDESEDCFLYRWDPFDNEWLGCFRTLDAAKNYAQND